MAQGGHTGHDFSRVRVTPAPPGSFQARLTVGHPGDRFEREADLIADRVMQTSVAEGGPPYAKQVRRSPELPPNRAPTESIRRAPDESGEMLAEEGDRDSAAPNADGEAAPPAGGMEASAHSAEQLAVTLLEEDDLEDSNASQAQAERSGGADGASTVQARALPGQTPTVPSRYETAVNALRGGGSPLPAESRTFFEARFGHDFSRVRIHTGPDAGRMARTFGARAFTIGRDMVFATCVALALTGFLAWYLATREERPARGARRVCYLATAAAVLAKGPIGAILPAVVVLGFLVTNREVGLLRRFWSWPLTALVLLIDGGWYALAIRDGGHAFVGVQLFRENVDRFVGKGEFHRRSNPFELRHSPIRMEVELVKAFFPWNLALLDAAVRRWRGETDTAAGRFLHAWWIAVLVVFSLAASTRTVYLLPLAPAIALPLRA
jgi:hypothetical protein